MTFGTVPATEWQLKQNIEESRRRRPLETSFCSIVQQITKQALLCDYDCKEISKFPGTKRIWMKLTLPSQTVDLFHSGGAGYRAQFYLGIQQGENANRFLIDSLLPAAERLCADRPKLSCCWEYIEASLCHRDAKCWIHEGAWLSNNKPADRNLVVDRWERNADKVTLKHRFEPSWAKLTPESEIHLEVKGGCVDQFFQPVDVLLKPFRSRELHDHGYT